MIVVLVVPGKPKGKGRPRFDPRRKRTYTPAETVSAEEHVRQVWREAGEPKFEGKPALRLSITIQVERPQSHFRKNGTLNTEGGRHPFPDNKKPDVDNALKLVMDALNSRAYHDDVQIVSTMVNRVWADWPMTTIVIQDMPGYAADQLALGGRNHSHPLLDL